MNTLTDIASMNFAEAEAAYSRLVSRYDSPAAFLAGIFWLRDPGPLAVPASASGNARQRRAQVRAWKRQGFSVTQTHAFTGAIIAR